MRDLLYKNLTSVDKKKRVIVTSEIADNQGVRSIIHRHLICVIKEVKDTKAQRPSPYLHVVKEHKTKEREERFYCRAKGSIFAVNNNKLFLILFMHSLKISLQASPQYS